MVGSHKILTVSYGTFSCTLEGFEDSFGTMKAIAEYFRDLAADDRYFGAVPPVPDAEMLTRIAEREIARRVEARMEASGIVLRVGQAPDPVMSVRTETAAEAPAPVAAVAPPAPQTEPVMPPAPVAVPLNLRPATLAPVVVAPAVVSEPVIAAPVPESPMVADARPTPPAHPDADSVAAKLQRIRAVVGKGSTTLVEPDSAEDGLDIAAFMSAPAPAATEPAAVEADLAAILAKVADAPEPEADEEQTPILLTEAMSIAVTEPVVAIKEAVVDLAAPTDTVADSEEMDDHAPDADADGTPASEDAATPPAPIRARVIKMRRTDFERTLAAGLLVEDAAEPSDALAIADDPDMPTTRDADMADMAMDAAEDMPADYAADYAEDLAEEFSEDVTDDFPDDLARDLADLERLDAMTDVELPADITVTADGDDLGLLDRLSDFDATLSPDDEADLLAELAAVENEAMDSDADALASIAADLADSSVAEPAIGDSAEADLDLMSMIAKVAGTEETRTAATSEPEELFEDEALADEAYAEEAIDPAFDEEVFAEAATADDITETAADEPETVSHAHLRAGPDDDEADLSRILSQTDAELSQPEARNRREAIAQLKAAVAATEAARRLGDKAPADETAEAENLFREDLQQVVRPRRPMTPQAEVRSERPRPAPLKLVASQRVDLPPAAARPTVKPGMPVRPRRVTIPTDMPSATTAATRSQATSFAAFAEEKGASGLADLLEAAAAYTSFVEGVEDFSRPQILRKVSELSTTPVSREDGLRSFGTLLREGRIMKAGNGRFVVNEETRFNPMRDAG